MVKGLASFIAYFSGMENSYAVIGGTACDIWCSDRGIASRVTKDIDMVLLVESMDPSFTGRFFSYIREMGYSHIAKGSGESEFYRFDHPADSSAPGMIELFSRKPSALNIPTDIRVTPVIAQTGEKSLSAILMDDVYYTLVRENISMQANVPCVTIPALIILKMKAWRDLSIRKQRGETVDSNDIKKHRNDVFRLVLIVVETDRINISEALRLDVHQFFTDIENNRPDMRMIAKNAGVPFVPYEDAIRALRAVLGMD